ncbi:MAG: hypothetical protein U9O91_08075 [Candidatus Caldatribacteriota bacterium]|nr:hypothetical protein [Candidatus Caldatribacteriota bacterium]
MHRIGICHFRVGLMDGVSLEIGKWETVLEKTGYKVYLLSGETSSLDATIIPELTFRTSQNKKDLL